MQNRYVSALISSSLSIVPMIAIVLLLHFSGLASITNGVALDNIWLILAGMVVLIIGLALFQIGASGSISKVGEYMGSSLSKQKNIFVVVLFAFTLGVLITCSEPSILIVSKQVTIVPNNELLNTVILVGGIAIGVGAFVVIGILRIVQHKSLKICYLLFYCLTFMLIAIIAMDPEKSKLLPFIFDSGGVTTGSATVPFILALGAGVAAVRGGKNAKNDSFGLVGVASIGPILSTALLIMFQSSIPIYNASAATDSSIVMKFLNALLPIGGTLGSMVEVFIAIAPILIIFFIYNFLYIKLPKSKILKLLVGFAFAYVGLTLFLAAANAAMTPIGSLVGQNLAKQSDAVIIIISFVVGLVTILCEPAVLILTKQIENMSDGNIRKPVVLLALSLGVGVAIALAATRALYGFSILYYVIPGYAICLVLMFFCPDIYTAMAFDSGGTASGPMAASFILPMIIGIVIDKEGASKVYENGFGVVALIALIPIIAIQILGVVQNIKTKRALHVMRAYVYSAEDAQIIHF